MDRGAWRATVHEVARVGHNLATKQLCLYMCTCVCTCVCVCACIHATMCMYTHVFFHICVCVCEFTCKCVCASAWGHVCEVFVCVCIHGHRSTVNLGDTISGYHVIAYDKLRVLYDNNDTRVPFPKMSKLIQVCI